MVNLKSPDPRISAAVARIFEFRFLVQGLFEELEDLPVPVTLEICMTTFGIRDLYGILSAIAN